MRTQPDTPANPSNPDLVSLGSPSTAPVARVDPGGAGRRRGRATALIVLLAVGAASSIWGQVVVDRFDTPGTDQSVALPPPGPGPVSATAAADVPWGTRELVIAGLVGAGGASEAGVNIGGSGVGELVNSVASRAEVSFQYRNPSGPPSLELGGSRFFTIEYVVDTATEFTIYLEDASGAAASSQLIALPGSGLLAWPDNAVAFGGLTETEVIELWIVPGLGGDVQVDNFILVPEPVLAAAIMAMGLAVLGVARRLSRLGPTA